MNWPSQESTVGKDNCGFGMVADLTGRHSHDTVQKALSALGRLKHRGAVGADGKTGDGCGITLALPRTFFHKLYANLSTSFAVGMIFLNQDEMKASHARELLGDYLARQGLSVFCWRNVPINTDVCGEVALANLPQIEQVIIEYPDELSFKDVERKLFIARKQSSSRLEHHDKYYYVCSLSCYTMTYKALVLPEALDDFYLDLSNSSVASDFALFHQRFSTNTTPQWWLAQPFRLLAHNGEINTIQANRLSVIGKRNQLLSPLLDELVDVNPLINLQGSDSSSLDNVVELLVQGGMPLTQAIRLLIPPAWENHPFMSDESKAYYDYYALHMEPWDGPSGLVMTDGEVIACSLDRNGLRPARYVLTQDDFFVLCSEVGVLEFSPCDIVKKGRVAPGELLAIERDVSSFESFKPSNLLLPEHSEQGLYQAKPYQQWLVNANLNLQVCGDKLITISSAELSAYQQYFVVHYEEMSRILPSLANKGMEAVGSMGDDTPLAVLSDKPRHLFDFFRQQFAQVTNPAIDSLREKIVMSLRTRLGPIPNLFCQDEPAPRVTLDSPVMMESQFNQLLTIGQRYRCRNFTLYYDPNESLEVALEALWQKVQQAISQDYHCVVITDKSLRVSKACIHPLLAVSLINQRLIELGMRHKVSIVVESGFVRDPHQFACLIAFGASAIYPYLAYQLIADLVRQENVEVSQKKALENYRSGIEKGLLKICSKMGISTINSYRGSQLFEVLGLSDYVVKMCFKGVVSKIGGLGFDALIHLPTINPAHVDPLINYGYISHHTGGEFHDYNPEVVTSLLNATKNDDRESFDRFSSLVNNRKNKALRDYLQINGVQPSIALEQVEPVEGIVTRFETAAMSLGAISLEAHETLAVAMNKLGGYSNSGEGGEDPSRHDSHKMSKIKQVASGRFGVTADYLINAEVIQIKIAQGAKPGEGGQLPGKKVNQLIADLRFSKPGVTLISPPPHHDIYSIEDLAQLIFDLKQVNPKALISVKLVAEPGIGTIAAGVAKAYADAITVSGYEGGTGASPLSSIKYAGSSWELGLLEVQQALQENGLRHRVRLIADGGLKTGLDVVKAALLGAEGFGFGTAPLIALGCKYLRICHLNNCATGVATQDKRLRENFYHGKADNVIRYFTWLAEDIRKLLAKLGYEQLNQIIGRSDLLTPIESDVIHLASLPLTPDLNKPRYCTQASNPSFDKGVFAENILTDVQQAIADHKPLKFNYSIKNYHRSIGANLAGFIAYQRQHHLMESLDISLSFNGSAGQSFGVWNREGVNLILIGDANDYVGKGMSGGSIIVYPAHDAAYRDDETTMIAGNTCLYGATGGQLYLAGCVGERFAIRNSGALAIVEGTGDHACEYMTAGTVVILGVAGINFAAGMTGGIAYVFDEKNDFKQKVNTELVEVKRVGDCADSLHRQHLEQLIQQHLTKTNSLKAARILDDFDESVKHFHLVQPKSVE